MMSHGHEGRGGTGWKFLSRSPTNWFFCNSGCKKRGDRRPRAGGVCRAAWRDRWAAGDIESARVDGSLILPGAPCNLGPHVRSVTQSRVNGYPESTTCGQLHRPLPDRSRSRSPTAPRSCPVPSHHGSRASLEHLKSGAGFTPTLPFKRFTVLALRSLIHFELIFVYGIDMGLQLQSFTGCPVFPQRVQKAPFFPHTSGPSPLLEM
ncbi:uncharacterized protein LOC119518898 [Choloepus didactylus]|uniref:uncharacterized protein LOC119518898 n=1 Tax=Choloepus didactylus TaxID=27675 RepID=UPI00189EE1DC|nr:uncharacterized protein LOC119518898 [Choloepus didactylus]